MKLRLIREPSRPNTTFGVLFIDGFFECFTLENTSKIIPAGIYSIKLYDSPKFHRAVPQLQNVPNRSFIEMHPANFYTDLEGCIGVGEGMNATMLENSRDAFDKLMMKVIGSEIIKIEDWA